MWLLFVESLCLPSTDSSFESGFAGHLDAQFTVQKTSDSNVQVFT
ncbi:hypothetical protein SAMN05443144_104179 [Fodinibius roseus]|uniref:Uncharacterized protein n=1 Tax=Fodinibius roseus TaxID=1194090 RepID=A0A1M4XPF9_9BACT|nr:hypothetical protein SAMN05443144_104179 [Fodinibius roseus]